MKTFSIFPRVDGLILFAGCLVVILLGGGITVSGPNLSLAGQTAFAGEALAESGKAPADGKKHMEKDCNEPPVTCQNGSLAQNPVPGCTSGQSCTLATAGKSCGIPGTGKVCMTVNNGSGLCTCLCQKVQ